MQKKYVTHYIYTPACAHTHIYMCMYIYICLYMKTENAYSLQCRISLCLGGWFSVKCRALYKPLGFFSNKVEMHCCLCLFERAQGAMVLERVLLLFPFVSWVTKKGLGGCDGSPFIFWGLPELLGWVWSVWPRTQVSQCCQGCLQWVHLPTETWCEFFFTHLGVFESWWAAWGGRHHVGKRITQNIWLYRFALDLLLTVIDLIDKEW